MYPMLEVNTDYGRRRAIQEDDLTLLTDAELRILRISRADLQRCFAEGVRLMRGKTLRDRVRPCANETLEGGWIVNLVHYSACRDQERA
jgi:hypothetical protein